MLDERAGLIGELTVMQMSLKTECGSLTACDVLLFTTLAVLVILWQALLQGLNQAGNVTCSRLPQSLGWNTNLPACSWAAGVF